jgi:hypothetical protein
MFRSALLELALASIIFTSTAKAAGYAESVISYNPGTGFATEFGSGAGYTNVAAALGEPSRITSGQFGGPVDPFNPPFLRDQILSIGAGGSLTVRLSAPALNAPGNPFGLDFLIFGNAGFAITNGNFSGGGITDGSLFSGNSGSTRVSVSADNITYFSLTPSLTPIVDGLFPTEGLGNFSLPVNPALSGSAFAGLTLGGIRSLYSGSGGGTGFDLNWAQDAAGNRVALDRIQFVRVDVLSGVSEIDAFSVVPEPSATLLSLCGVALVLFARAQRRLGKK